MNPMDMTDEQFLTYRARQWAAALYISEGFPDYAARVERGEVDGCQGMRLALFMVS